MLENWIDTWKAGYIERCTSGLEGSAWKPTAAMWQGAGCLPYELDNYLSKNGRYGSLFSNAEIEVGE